MKLRTNPLAERIAVSEIFGPTLQGEGPHAGEPTVFVRTGGCDFRCSWCDSLYAVDPQFAPTWLRMDPTEILAELSKLWTAAPPCSLTLSGGNPAIWNGLGAVAAHWPGPVRLETQGTIVPTWLSEVTTIVVSPKPPSSGQPGSSQLQEFMQSVPSTCETVFKVACDTQADLEWAVATHAPYKHQAPLLYIQPVNDPTTDLGRDELIARWERLWGWLSPMRLPHVRLSHQQHVLAWGNTKGV